MAQCARDSASSWAGPACSDLRLVIAHTVSTVFLPRTMRSRVIRQTCAAPFHSGASRSRSEAVVLIRRVSIRP
jgi:hypothetical protein